MVLGRNAEGQLGLGAGITDDSKTPQPVMGLPNPSIKPIVAIAAGSNFTCALDSTGKVWCWGENTYNQLGNEQSTSVATPVPQGHHYLVGSIGTPASQATAITAGEDHACALRPSDGPVCWGFNDGGQLGAGNTPTYSNVVPVDTSSMGSGVSAPTFVQIAASGNHTCLLANTAFTSGQVWCWGYNTHGELGNNSTNDSSTPMLVNGLSGIVELALGENHTCARRSGASLGTITCWGYNDQGQLGDNTTTSRLAPVASSFGAGNTGLAAGANHTCAMKANGAVQCVGANDSGQLGNNQRGHDSALPLQIPNFTNATALSVGGHHVCALRTVSGHNNMACWGRNTSGQLGDQTTGSRATPSSVLSLATYPNRIGAGDNHTCAINADGSLQCWGNGLFGQLGIGSYPFAQTTPAFVDNTELNADPVRLATGGYHTCAAIYEYTIPGTKKVLCWGSNTYGQLGTDDGQSYSSPQVTVGLQAALAIDTGHQHTCMVAIAPTSNIKQVWCWGANYNGQVGKGDETASEPTPINVNAVNSGPPLPTDWLTVATGHSHSCALSATQGIWCWGLNGSGQLGNGVTSSPLPNPVQAHLPISGGQEVVAGSSHTCARYSNGWLCWGANYYGQLGNGSYMSTNNSDPVLHPALPDNSKVAHIDAGGNTTCAIDSSGHVWCWGDGYWGQLGDGETGFATTPVNVAAFPPGTNTLPVANPQTVYTAQGQALSITLTGSDADGDALSFSIVPNSGPSHGSLSAIDANTHIVTYTPDPGYTGDDSFQFVVNDGTVDSAPATVSITVTAFAIFKNGFEEP